MYRRGSIGAQDFRVGTTMTEIVDLAARIDAVLPQTQCTKCGFDGCRPYAAAIATGEAPINRCPPGGAAGIARLAQLLATPELPLDPVHGKEGELLVARIDERHCIGCTLCIQACPVDAIIGGAKRMHTVWPELCSGCDLCVAPCPVDCIEMVPAMRTWDEDDANAARTRHDRRAERLAHEALKKASRRELDLSRRSRENAIDPSSSTSGDPPAVDPADRKRAIIAAALERARLALSANRGKS